MQFDPRDSQSPAEAAQEKPVAPAPHTPVPEVPVQGLAEERVPSISYDAVKNATREELTAIVDTIVLRPKEEASTLMLVKALAEDPDEAIDGFRSVLCTAIADTLVRYCGDCPMEKIDPVYHTLELMQTTIDSLLSNPRHQIPESMNDLLHAALDFVASLDEDRPLFEELHRDVDPTSDYSVFLNTVANTYSFALNQVEDVIGSGFFTPNERLAEAGNVLVGRQLEWLNHGMSPVQEERVQMVRIWRAGLEFAALMGVSEYAKEVKSITQQLIAWEVTMESEEEIVRDLERGGEEIDEDERMDRAEELSECLNASIRALRRCDDGTCQELWKQTVAALGVHSMGGRLALIEMAKEDITETEVLLHKMLRSMVKEGQPTRGISRRMDTLDMYLNVPGAAGLFEDMFLGNLKHTLDPVVHSKLFDFFRARLDRHYACATEGFRERQRAIDNNYELSIALEKYDRAGILWSERTRLALESVVNPQEAH